jgi:hypothetical protein
MIISLIYGLLLRPDKQWADIVAANKNEKSVFVSFVVPLLCLLAVCTVIGSVLYDSRMDFSFGYMVRKIAVPLCSLSLGLYLSAFLVNVLMTTLHIGPRNLQKIFGLMAYAFSVACLVICMVALFPFFKELLVLSFFSVYLYWRGIPYMLDIPENNRPAFLALSLVVLALVYALAFYFFKQILSAIF